MSEISVFEQESIMWTRDPFFGGCSYHSPRATVTGYYSPLEFEADCNEWTATNRPGEIFPTADAAMNAADGA